MLCFLDILLILVPLLHLPKIKLIISKFNLNCKIFVLDSITIKHLHLNL